jgi:hypothetical protein
LRFAIIPCSFQDGAQPGANDLADGARNAVAAAGAILQQPLEQVAERALTDTADPARSQLHPAFPLLDEAGKTIGYAGHMIDVVELPVDGRDLWHTRRGRGAVQCSRRNRLNSAQIVVTSVCSEPPANDMVVVWHSRHN